VFNSISIAILGILGILHQVNIHWSSSRFSQVWLDSYFPSYNPQLLAQLEDYLEIRKLQ
jgi:hypothetical protein